MTLGSIDTWWWPYLFVILSGWAMTYPWRALGVYLGGHIREDAEILVLVRAIGYRPILLRVYLITNDTLVVDLNV